MRVKSVIGQYKGRQHGPINRVVDPGDLGEQLKPFVFLDFFDAPVQKGFGFGMHPHSGIATLTWQPACDLFYEDTAGASGILKAGGLEWFNAGGGAWHQGHFVTDGVATGFQLWVAMPPGIEDGIPSGLYVAPGDVPVIALTGTSLADDTRKRLPVGELRLLLGTVDAEGRTVSNPIPSHQDMVYAAVTLQPGTRWEWHVPAHHDVCWLFPYGPGAQVAGVAVCENLLVFGEGDAVVIEAGPDGACFALGSAKRHEHPLVLGPSSVHTNEQSLRDGFRRIREVGATLKNVR